ncbi:hypothetical protein FOL47_006462 [Perkinsus chesapeaki]|uniref:Tyr recombinase domain-containing protein n=1 Tax=Perkinsus chesapeaki TaxID=330153 RepID=A0A7J6MXZ1_PERCH|nr:hypothetical protein FOL47_006462 [Perkinsus chesapeaki]
MSTSTMDHKDSHFLYNHNLNLFSLNLFNHNLPNNNNHNSCNAHNPYKLDNNVYPMTTPTIKTMILLIVGGIMVEEADTMELDITTIRRTGRVATPVLVRVGTTMTIGTTTTTTKDPRVRGKPYHEVKLTRARAEAKIPVVDLSSSLEVSATSLVTCIVSLTKKNHKYGTVVTYLSNIRTEGRLYEISPLTVAEEEQVRLCLQAAKRMLTSISTKRTVTLTLEQIRLLIRIVPRTGHRDSRVAFLTGTFALLRLKEVVSLTPGDVHVGCHDQYLILHIRSSKTDQSGTGANVILGCVQGLSCTTECTDDLCAMHQLFYLLRKGPDLHNQPTIFGLSYGQLSADINFLVNTVFQSTDPNIEVGRKTSHSMRRTGVCLLADAGVPLPVIAEYGRWKDVSVVENVYMRDHTQRTLRELKFAQLMSGNVESLY